MAKPGRRCSICAHDRRVEIDLALVAQVPHATISERYGCSPDALSRHSANHLSASQRAGILVNLAPSAVDLDKLSKSESESLLSNLISQRARLSTYAAECASEKNWRAATAAERVITENISTVARLLGAIVNRSEITHAYMTLTPNYLRLQQILVEELRSHPELGARIAARLATLEMDEANAITVTATKAPVMIEHRP